MDVNRDLDAEMIRNIKAGFDTSLACALKSLKDADHEMLKADLEDLLAEIDALRAIVADWIGTET